MITHEHKHIKVLEEIRDAIRNIDPDFTKEDQILKAMLRKIHAARKRIPIPSPGTTTN